MAQVPDAQPIAETNKQRCPTDNSTQFYWVKQGLSYRCRHCKGIVVVPWQDILRKHEELCIVQKKG